MHHLLGLSKTDPHPSAEEEMWMNTGSLEGDEAGTT